MTGPRPLDNGGRTGWGLLTAIVAVYIAMVMVFGFATAWLRKVVRAWRDR